MYFSKLSTLFALSATTLATAIPNPVAASDLVARDAPTIITINFPNDSDISTLSAQAFGGGVEGTLELQWIDSNSIRSKYVVKDTKGDSHSVYMVTVLYDGGNEVLRCQNGRGNGNTEHCDWKRYDRSKTIKYIKPRWCVDIQRGGDDCLTGPAFYNPYA